MNRRDFCKLFAASAASASASKVLASIPEAEPKIELLEPKIVTDIPIIDTFVWYRITIDNHVKTLLQTSHLEGIAEPAAPQLKTIIDSIQDGRCLISVNCSIYVDLNLLNQLSNFEPMVRFIFPVIDHGANTKREYSRFGEPYVPFEFKNTVFKLTKVKMSAAQHELGTTEILAMGVYHP